MATMQAQIQQAQAMAMDAAAAAMPNEQQLLRQHQRAMFEQQQQQQHKQQQQQHLDIPEDEDDDGDEDGTNAAMAGSMVDAPISMVRSQQQQQQQQQQQSQQSQQSQASQQSQQQPRTPRTPTATPPPASAQQQQHMQVSMLPVPCCRVEGCWEDLSTAGDYHRRHKVCKMHATSPMVVNHGQEQRFCQQCSRFHALSEFDEGKRSCRKRLAGHNERRRRHQPDSLAATTSGDSPPLPSAARDKKAREISKRGRSFGSGSGAARRGSRNAAPYAADALMLASSDDGGSNKRRKNSEEVFSDAMAAAAAADRSSKAATTTRGDGRGGLRLDGERLVMERREMEELEIDVPDMEQVKEGLDLGEGIVIPPLPFKRDGRQSLLKGWQEDRAEEMRRMLEQLRPAKDDRDKKSWQRDDKEALLHCFWECPKAAPVWGWVGRQLGKLRGAKVRLEMRQAVLGARLEAWATAEAASVWRLLRGIVLWQLWVARKGKVLGGVGWSSNKVVRAAWVDLMMYAMQDWLEVLKKKEAGKQDDAAELRSKFDNKWLVNQFAGRRAEWTMIWKDPDDVLLD